MSSEVKKPVIYKESLLGWLWVEAAMMQDKTAKETLTELAMALENVTLIDEE
jgi:hypothetical protein